MDTSQAVSLDATVPTHRSTGHSGDTGILLRVGGFLGTVVVLLGAIGYIDRHRR